MKECIRDLGWEDSEYFLVTSEVAPASVFVVAGRTKLTQDERRPLHALHD